MIFRITAWQRRDVKETGAEGKEMGLRMAWLRENRVSPIRWDTFL